MDSVSVQEVQEEAERVASTYNHHIAWKDWSPNARDDFWDMAQDNLDISPDRRVSMPDDKS